MSLIVPISIQTAVITDLLSADLRLKLYSNNYTPTPNSVIASFTEVTGGGYAAIPLVVADWVIGTTSPVTAFQTAKTFSFTGVTGGPGTVFGYYVTNIAGNVLYWAEPMPGAYFPFTPTNGAYVRIVPFISVSGGSVGS